MLRNSKQAGLDWSALFLSKNEYPDKKSFFQLLKITPHAYDKQFLTRTMYSDFISRSNEYLADACERVALKFCFIDSDFAKDVLPPESFDKAVELYRRKQFTAKLLQDVLSDFQFLLHYNANEQIAHGIFCIGIQDILQEVYAEKTDKIYTPLKKAMAKIVSGINAKCYLDAQSKTYFYNYLMDEESNTYLLENYQYDFNKSMYNGKMSLYFRTEQQDETTNRMLQMALFPDEAFWSNHPDFHVLFLLESVRQNNDAKHAEKLLTYIFDTIKNDAIGKKILENNLPLFYMDKDTLLSGIEDRNHRFRFERFEKLSCYQKIKGPFCLPFSVINQAEKKCEEGQKVFFDFLKDFVYPGNDKKVKDFILHHLASHENSEWPLSEVLDNTLLWGSKKDDSDRLAILLYAPDYFSEENVLNRVYIEAHAMKNAFPEELLYPCMFECFYNAIQVIEDENHIHTALQLDMESRNTAFDNLCKILRSYDIHPTEKYKPDYIVSLLDRKVAILQEAERFPVLEQLGDAIYGLAVAELMFYQQDAEEETFKQNYENYISAATQVKICKISGLDSLYIAATQYPEKYLDDGVHADLVTKMNFERGNQNCNEKYLADSLEMIIGTICLENGITTAMQFAKKLLLTSLPNHFKKEIRYTLETIQDIHIERDYFTRILPAPYSTLDNDCIRVLSDAFGKVMLCTVLGTDDKKTRNYITSQYGVAEILDAHPSYYEVTAVFDCYLREGIENAICKFKPQILERYRQKVSK